MSADNQEAPNLFNSPADSAGGSGLTVGPLLRETRMKLGRELSVVSATLRIRQPFLEAIEDSRFRDLPGATYAIGFVRGYAEYLGLDGHEIVRRFKQENGDLARGNHLVFPSAVSEGGIPTGALLAFAVVAAVGVYFGWHWYQGREQTPTENVSGLPDRLSSLIRQPVGNGTEIVPVSPGNAGKASDSPVAPSIAAMTPAPHEETPPPPETSPAPQAVTPSEPAPTPPSDEVQHPAKGKDKPAKVAVAPPPAPAAAPTTEPLAEETPSAESGGRGHIVLQALDNCWIKILDANGKVLSSRLMQKGQTFVQMSRPGQTMTVGDAGALKIVVDGKEIPSLGGHGMVRHDIPLDAARLLGGSSGTPTSAPEPTGDMPAPERPQ